MRIALVVALLFLASPVEAVTITGGAFESSAQRDFAADYHLTGPNFRLDCTEVGRCGGAVSDTSVFNVIRPLGIPLPLQEQFRIEDVNRLVLDGNTFRARGNVTFTSDQVVRSSNVTTPFTMAGQLDLLHPETLADVGDVSVAGRGTANATFDETGAAQSLRFAFEPPPPSSSGTVMSQSTSVVSSSTTSSGTSSSSTTVVQSQGSSGSPPPEVAALTEELIARLPPPSPLLDRFREMGVQIQQFGEVIVATPQGGFLSSPLLMRASASAPPIVNPEPTTVALLGTGAALVALLRWRHTKRSMH